MTKKKITTGFVIQTFDDNNKCIKQEFTAGDPVEWEDENGLPIDCPENDEYQPYDMVQPQAMAVAIVSHSGFRAIGPFTDLDEAVKAIQHIHHAVAVVMESPYEAVETKLPVVRSNEEFGSKIPATTMPIVGTMTEDGRVFFHEEFADGAVVQTSTLVKARDVLALLESLENPHRSFQIRTESVARQIRALCPEVESVNCKFCHKSVPIKTAHLHDGGYVGDDCCWDERLRSSE